MIVAFDCFTVPTVKIQSLRDSKFGAEVIRFPKATGLEPRRTSVQSPLQNGTAERWVGSCPREILDHVIALNERHLRQLIRDYVDNSHQDRARGSLEKDTPNRRPVEPKPGADATLTSWPIATRGEEQRSGHREPVSPTLIRLHGRGRSTSGRRPSEETPQATLSRPMCSERAEACARSRLSLPTALAKRLDP
ncbi:MAG: hypothetical protein ACK5AZ_21995 [Bryobacteraceae bacterium]